jgi:uncharacterized protein GlcG (DUF336 family)
MAAIATTSTMIATAIRSFVSRIVMRKLEASSGSAGQIVSADSHAAAVVLCRCGHHSVWIGSIDVSINKAFTARAFDISTAELSKNSQPGQQFYGIQNSNHGRIMIFAGGVPLRRNGSVVGAIGVSGGSGVQDQAVATAGASAITH